MRTADVASINAEALLEVENALMKLSDVIGASYFTSHERSETAWESLE
jgi:hypothetical protein